MPDNERDESMPSALPGEVVVKAFHLNSLFVSLAQCASLCSLVVTVDRLLLFNEGLFPYTSYAVSSV